MNVKRIRGLIKKAQSHLWDKINPARGATVNSCLNQALAELQQQSGEPVETPEPKLKEYEIHLACDKKEEFYTKLRALIPEDLFEKTRILQSEPPVLSEVEGGELIEPSIQERAELPECSSEYISGLEAEIDRLTVENKKLKDDIADAKLELACPETLGLTNEPIYKQIALIQCVKLQQAEQIAKLNIILYHRENGLSHPDFKPEIEISKQAERIEELENENQLLKDKLGQALKGK